MPSSISVSDENGRRLLLRAASGAAVLFVAYNVGLSTIRPRLAVDLDAGTENRIIAERYLFAPVQDAVLVGSSLGRTLTPYLPVGFYNLSFSGGSATSGAQIVLHGGAVPPVVVIEMNVLTRNVDAALVADVTGAHMLMLRRLLPALRTEYRPLHFALPAAVWAKERAQRSLRSIGRRLGKLLVPGTRQQAAAAASAAPEPTAPVVVPATGVAKTAAGTGASAAQPPDPMLEAGLRQQTDYYSTVRTQMAKSIEETLAQMAAQVRALKERRTCVLLVSLPIDPSLERLPLSLHMHARAKEVLGGTGAGWLEIVNDGSFRTVDSIHLASDDARRVSAIVAGAVHSRAACERASAR